MKEKIKRIEELYKRAVTEAFGRIEEHMVEFEKTGKQRPQEEIKENIIKCRKRAIKYIDEILEIDSKNIKALGLKGFVLGNMRKFGQAEFYYDQALEINPNDYFALSGKANLLKEQGKYEVAIDYFEKAYKVDPKNITPLFLKLFCLQELLSFFHELMSKYKTSSKEWKNLFREHENLFKKYRKAEKEYNKAIEKDEDVQSALNLLKDNERKN